MIQGAQQDLPGTWFLHSVIQHQPPPEARSPFHTQTFISVRVYDYVILCPSLEGDMEVGDVRCESSLVSYFVLGALLEEQESFVPQKTLSCCPFLDVARGGQYTDEFLPKPHASSHPHKHLRDGMSFPPSLWLIRRGGDTKVKPG